MKNNFWKYLLILSLLLNFSLLAAAGYTYYKQFRYRATAPLACGSPGDYLFRELSLEPQQIKLFQQKAESFHGLLGKERREVDQLRRTLFGLLRADHPDDKIVEAAIIRINAQQHEIQKMVVAHILEFKSLLNGEQQKKLLDLIEGSMGKRKEALCP